MAMTLKKPARRWLELPHGVRVEVEPLTTARYAAARHEALQRIAARRAEDEAAEKAGQPADAASIHVLEGLFVEYRAEALTRGIVRWEGLNGDDGHPMPVTTEAREMFAQDRDLAEAFLDAYAQPLRDMAAEGEGSGTSAASAGQPVPTDTAADVMDAPSAGTESPKDTAAPAPAS